MLNLALLGAFANGFRDFSLDRVVELADKVGWSGNKETREAAISFTNPVVAHLRGFGDIHDKAVQTELQKLQVVCIEVRPHCNRAAVRHMESDCVYLVVNDGQQGELSLELTSQREDRLLYPLTATQVIPIPRGVRHGFCTQRAKSSLWLYRFSHPWINEVRYD